MAAALLALLVLGSTAGCGSPAKRAARAMQDYQAAIAIGDVDTARRALVRATTAKDDDPQMWMELAKIQMQEHLPQDAMYSFARVRELDRSNLEALLTLSSLALASGQHELAKQYIDEAALLAPDSTDTLLASGFLALQERRLPDAIAKADTILAKTPANSPAKILKARALAGSGEFAAGAKLLEEQVKLVGADDQLLASLLQIYLRGGDPSGVALTRKRQLALKPDDRGRQLAAMTAFYDAGQPAAGREIGEGLLAQTPSGEELVAILSAWLRHEPRSWSIPRAQQIAADPPPGGYLPLAQFFISAGVPQLASRVLAGAVSLPVTARNANVDGMAALAKAATGDADGALQLANAVLRYDQQNTYALRARADLHLRTGCPEQTYWDVQRLVGHSGDAYQDRLRLARCYALQNRPDDEEAVYYKAFRDMPGRADVYRHLKDYLLKSGKKDAVVAVDQEYRQQSMLAMGH